MFNNIKHCQYTRIVVENNFENVQDQWNKMM